MDFLTRTIKFPESIDDSSIAHFHRQSDLAIRSEANVVLIDFAEVEFMSSPSLMALVVVFKQVRKADKRLFLSSVNEQVRMLLELTGMDEIFEILESLDDVSNAERSLALSN